MSANLVDLTPAGHGLRIQHAGETREAHCLCGWVGTAMRGTYGHQAAVDQYASHLRSAE